MSRATLAIHGGSTAKTKPFPEWPIYDEREAAAVVAVLESRQWAQSSGSQVAAFEREFAAYHGAGGALAVGNGTQAIELSLLAHGIGRGDEVIVPAFTYIATATAVLCVNAVPTLADVDPHTYCLDPAAVEAAITPRTRAIMPVHMAGHVTDMDALNTVARRHGLVVIEEAAIAHGSEWRGRRVGALGDSAIFSFQAIKAMTAGEGGIIISNNAEFIDRCFLFGNGRSRQVNRAALGRDQVLGSNCRLAEMPAAMLRVQLQRLDKQIARREHNAALLDQLLGDVEGVTPQGRDGRVTRHCHSMYMFRYNAAAFGDMPGREFVEALNAEGVPAFQAFTAVHHTPLFRQRSFAPRWRADDPLLPDYTSARHPVAEVLADEVVCLHHRVLLGDEADVNELVGAIEKIRAHQATACVA